MLLYKSRREVTPQEKNKMLTIEELEIMYTQAKNKYELSQEELVRVKEEKVHLMRTINFLEQGTFTTSTKDFTTALEHLNHLQNQLAIVESDLKFEMKSLQSMIEDRWN